MNPSLRDPKTARLLLATLAVVVSVGVFAVGIVASLFLRVAMSGSSDAGAFSILAAYTCGVGGAAFATSFGATFLVARLFPREARLGVRQPLATSLGAAVVLTAVSLLVLVAL